MKKNTKNILGIIGILLILGMIGLNYWYDHTINDITELIVVKREGLDTQIPLDEQINLLGTEEFKTTEVNNMKGQYVTNFEQIKGKTLIVPIEIGNPIPLEALK
ncbi:hypothetical protein [Niallia endozanthoxylica]|uniref:Uncharacterized protein n=1 Tax=Niallia endozanthoxylica TaxID=2036016 RepID=A0A5J5HTV8_9BACI|nr:hypothetical protein [Niallia endozanthoxylica]KAA9023827.1 hypothetical protein F4V44_11840 [Niallia endozanthoxylica]